MPAGTFTYLLLSNKLTQCFFLPQELHNLLNFIVKLWYNLTLSLINSSLYIKELINFNYNFKFFITICIWSLILFSYKRFMVNFINNKLNPIIFKYFGNNKALYKYIAITNIIINFFLYIFINLTTFIVLCCLLNGNIILNDCVLVKFTSNDCDVTVQGPLVTELYNNYGGAHTFGKASIIAGAILRNARFQIQNIANANNNPLGFNNSNWERGEMEIDIPGVRPINTHHILYQIRREDTDEVGRKIEVDLLNKPGSEISSPILSQLTGNYAHNAHRFDHTEWINEDENINPITGIKDKIIELEQDISNEGYPLDTVHSSQYYFSRAPRLSERWDCEGNPVLTQNQSILDAIINNAL